MNTLKEQFDGIFITILSKTPIDKNNVKEIPERHLLVELRTKRNYTKGKKS